MGQLPMATQSAADRALDRLIDAVCPFTDGYVPDAIRILEAIWAVPDGVQTLNQLDPVGPYLRRRRREFE